MVPAMKVAVGAGVSVGWSRICVEVGALPPPPHAVVRNTDSPIRNQTKIMLLFDNDETPFLLDDLFGPH